MVHGNGSVVGHLGGGVNMAMTMQSVTSLSGRHAGVFIVSDDPNIIKNSLALTEAFKAVIQGGDKNGQTNGNKSVAAG